MILRGPRQDHAHRRRRKSSQGATFHLQRVRCGDEVRRGERRSSSAIIAAPRARSPPVLERSSSTISSRACRQAPKGLGAGGDVRTSKCQECGASVVFADGVTATRCTFCGSSKVLEQAENENAIRPESLLPFAVDKKRANSRVRRLARQALVPPERPEADGQGAGGGRRLRALLDLRRARRVVVDGRGRLLLLRDRGVHDAGERPGGHQGRARSSARAGSAPGATAPTTSTTCSCARRWACRASSPTSCRTFDTTQLVPYSPGFLAGWRAEEYAVDLQAGFGFAQGKMEHEQEKPLRQGRAGRHAPQPARRQYLQRHHVQARALAGVDRGLSLQQPDLPLPRERADRRGASARRRGAGSRSRCSR